MSIPLAAVRHQQGRLTGRMESLGFDLRQEAVLRTLTGDVVKTSEIEGEKLDAEQVRSSIGRRLGIDVGELRHPDREVEGVVEMMFDATRHYDRPLTSERLHAWHASLFPTGRSGMRRIRVGAWRDDATGPMQVVSGHIGRERVHFEAPAANRLDHEMSVFLDWFNAPAAADEVLRASLAHLWFVSIHPLDDGNGRVARALADMLLARSEQRTQRCGLDVTPWMQWFLDCLGRAIDGAQDTLAAVLKKACFWESVRTVPAQRASAYDAEPAARQIRGQADGIKMGEDYQVLP